MGGASTELLGLQDAAVSLARLDESVRAMGVQSALPVLLVLRSAQAIVARAHRPSGDDGPAHEHGAARLIAEWYAPRAREFLRATASDSPAFATPTADAHANALAVAQELHATIGHGALAATHRAELSEPVRAVWDDAEREGWPSVLRSAALSSGESADDHSVPAALLRAGALTIGDVLGGAYVVAPAAAELVGALQGIAREGRATRRRVEAYAASCLAAESRCAELGRGGATARAVVELLQQRPALMVADIVEARRIATPTACAAVERLAAVGVVREITGRGRDRVFVYEPAVTLTG